MRNIEELTAREQQLSGLAGSVVGTMEDTAIENLSIFQQYKVIHQEYADLSNTNLQALKRALFLYWYSCVEPPCYTGLGDLNPNAISKTMSTLNDYLLKGMADTELNWMLNYYFSWDYIFLDHTYLKGINNMLENKMESNLPKTIDRAAMKQRGQMGQYWNSLTAFQ